MILHMVQELTTYSVISLAIGFGAYRLGWRRSPSLIVTVSLTFGVALPALLMKKPGRSSTERAYLLDPWGTIRPYSVTS